MSSYGDWSLRDGVPVFHYRADQDAVAEAEWDPIQAPRTRRHWLLLGNRGIRMQVANDGRVALLDERHGLRWLTAPDPAGTGVSIVEQDGERWGSAWDLRPAGGIPVRSFGPTWFEVSLGHGGLALERMLLCPEGESPWVLVRVRLRNEGGRARQLRHVEEWALVPRFLNVLGSEATRREHAAGGVAFEVETSERGLVAVERRLPGSEQLSIAGFPQVFGPCLSLVVEALGSTQVAPEHDGAAHPVLRLCSDLSLAPGAQAELWFRVGDRDGTALADPAGLVRESRAALRERLPRAQCDRCPQAAREIPWHAALLTGGLSRDERIGGHTLNQGSAYLFPLGFNGAARDPLQHALPLVYFQPEMALSVLRNTSAWSAPDGELPYALDGAKQPAALGFEPSDQSLWALALAAEYAAATGDLAAFSQELAYHPSRAAPPVPLAENLRRQFRFFVDGVGLGEHGHVRIRNADWNDMAVVLSGVEREKMARAGESVLNSAMAAWVLPVYAGLCERLGDAETASEARALGDRLR